MRLIVYFSLNKTRLALGKTNRTWWRGRPTMEGKTARGASSPAKPALHMPDPLSTTRAAASSSHILELLLLLMFSQRDDEEF